MNAKPPLIVLSAGGTGGHMTPAAALARDLKSRGDNVILMTDARGMKYKNLFEDCEILQVRAGTVKPGFAAKLVGLGNLAAGTAHALWTLYKLKPDVVVGFGGYPSFPAVYAAQKLKIPTIIHEQNAIIGRANHMLAPRAERIALSLPLLHSLDDTERARSVITGNPVRADISALYSTPYPKLEAGGELRILVLGGSLGAKVFSRIVPDALVQLTPDYRARLKISHQAREDDVETVRKAYEESGIQAEVSSFFNDVPDLLGRAHLVIGRAGASMVAEVAAAGRPAIFVPYPHHKDQQQKVNADVLADAGGAWVMTEDGFTSDALLTRIETFFQNPETLFRTAENARSCGRPDAARKLGNLVTALASGWEQD